MRQDSGQALRVSGRCREAYPVESGLDGGKTQFPVFLARQIDEDEAVDTGIDGILQEGVVPIGMDGIVVPHENDGCVVIIPPDLAHDVDGAGQGHAGLESPLRGGLDDRSVRHGVGEGMPISMMSAPAPGRPAMRRAERCGSGSPAVTKAASPARCCLAISAKHLSMRVPVTGHSQSPGDGEDVLAPLPHMFMQMT